MATLGLDFGTSNTAAALAVGGRPWVVPLEDGREVIPTAVFLDAGTRQMLFGHAAVAALTDGREGRFMRALKRLLGTPLMREQRSLMGRRMTLIEVVAAFLSLVKDRAEAQTGLRFDAVLSGRPVLFHADPARDRAAEADLADCYRAAGFAGVDFLYEPEAAALTAGPGEGLALVVDIGGGTSDFTLFREGPAGHSVLASRGLRVGGTDFDRAISLAHAMPELGMGGLLRAVFGGATHEAPVALFHDLATWEKIAFLYSPETRRAAEEMAKVAVDPVRFRRLVRVLRDETGHDIAFAVERAKIAANGGAGRIDLSQAERGLSVALPGVALETAVAPFAAAIAESAAATVAAGGARPADVARVVMVGGSGLIRAVREGVAQAFPEARIVQAGAFSAVAEGLGLAAARRDDGPARVAAVPPGA